MAGNVLNFFRDGLFNIVSGRGTTADKRTHATYHLTPLTPQQIDAAYRTSWLMRKVVDLPPYDMTRAGRDWKAEKADIAKLEAEEKRLQLWANLRRALILGRLGGGALILGADGTPDTPIGAAAKLNYIVPVSRYQLTLGELIADLADPLFGQPKFYRLASTGRQADIHPSRVIAFKGLPVAGVGMSWSADDLFWGDSVLQSVQDAVKNADMAQGGFASLIDEAKIDIYKIPGLTTLAATAEYEAALTRRMTTSNLFKSQFNALLLDAGNGGPGEGEEWDQRQVNWSGIPDIIRTYVSLVAGAADIPATRLLGKAPDGMNATGEGDERNYLTMILARQESDLRPALDILDPMLAAGAGVGGDLYSEFAPLKVLSEKEQAEVNKAKADAIKIIVDTGLVPEIAMEKGVQNLLIEDGWLPGLDEALNDLPKDERFPSQAEPEDPEQLGLVDPSAVKGGDPVSPTARGGRKAGPARAVNDAAPRSLYVSRSVVNVAEIKAWAKAQGLPELQDDLHVTIAYSRQPLDWRRVETEDWNQKEDGTIEIPPGGVRIVEPLGDRTAVLLFTSSRLSWRHEQIIRAGASHDYPDYQPHISLTGEPADLSSVEPYRGKIVLGPERFEEVKSDRV